MVTVDVVRAIADELVRWRIVRSRIAFHDGGEQTSWRIEKVQETPAPSEKPKLTITGGWLGPTY